LAADVVLSSKCADACHKKKTNQLDEIVHKRKKENYSQDQLKSIYMFSYIKPQTKSCPKHYQAMFVRVPLAVIVPKRKKKLMPL